MKYLVTGANGFVGSNLVKDLLANGNEVRGLVRKTSNRINLKGLDLELVEGDIRNPEDMVKAVEGVDGVFHTAALYSFWSSSYDDFYRTNVEGTLNVLNGAKKVDVDRVVVTSTASLLAHSEDKQSLPKSTDQLPSDYKLSKYMAEKEALNFAEETGLQVIIASPTVPIGPGDYGPTPTGRLILEFLNGKMKGYVEMKFNLVDVGDVARGHLLAMEKGESGERYVLGHKNWSLSEVIGVLARLTGLPKPRFEIPYPIALTAAWIDEFFEGFLMNRKPAVPISAIHSTRVDERIDPSPWMEELGLPETPTAESLKKAVDWFLENGYVNKPEAVKS
ncbi:SDR family oxidoreductase [Candidatus Bipolaricaulota bacterium]|nr:SDR family oxidoreductase [Candidatus Bipolaricaulota bacterium]